MIIAALIVLGLIFGSFVNALVWRLYEQDKRARSIIHKAPGTKKKKQSGTEDLSILKGRSMCPHCHHTLAAKDLVPVLSWLMLGGKCRYCRKPIAWQYPLVELLTAGLFVWSYLAWPLGSHGAGLFQLVVWLAFVVAFVALAVYDLRWFVLPDRIVLPVCVLAVVEVVVVALWHRSWMDVWQPAAGMAIIFGLFWGLFQVSKGGWIGGGDVKLAFALGLLAATPLKALLLLFLASLLGTLVSLPALGKGKRALRAQVPFGPYLLLATFIVQLYGTHIVTWYQNLLVV